MPPKESLTLRGVLSDVPRVAVGLEQTFLFLVEGHLALAGDGDVGRRVDVRVIETLAGRQSTQLVQHHRNGTELSRADLPDTRLLGVLHEDRLELTHAGELILRVSVRLVAHTGSESVRLLQDFLPRVKRLLLDVERELDFLLDLRHVSS